MALATRCPNCGALFRVAADQLKSRGGMVRCGSCRRVFNAVGRLEYLDPRRAGNEEALEPLGGAEAQSERRERVPPPLAPLPMRVPSRLKDGMRDATAAPIMPLPVETVHEASPPAAAAPSGARPVPGVAPPPTIGVPIMPLASGTSAAPAMAAGGASQGAAARAPAPPVAAQRASTESIEHGVEGTAERAAEETAPAAPRMSRALVPLDRFRPLERALEPSEDDDDTWSLAAEPEFLRRQRASAGAGAATRTALGVGCALLACCLAVEIALLARASLLVHFPQLRPTLAALCAPLSCSVQWPMRPELLAVISSELESQPGTPALEFSAVVRNRAAFPMALPSLELTITDSLNRPVARRIFSPTDYLGAPDPADPDGRSLAPGEDLTIRLLFELRGASAAGFVAYPFYP